MQNLASFIEYTDKPYTHTFMRMQLDNGTIEENGGIFYDNY